MKHFPKNAALKRHINRQHQSVPKKCDFCNLKSKRIDHLNAHMKICQEKNNPTMATKKNEIIQRTESEPLVRRKAKTTNDSEKDVEQLEGEEIENGKKIGKCQFCSKDFLNIFQLQKHLVDTHKIKDEFVEKHLRNGNNIFKNILSKNSTRYFKF